MDEVKATANRRPACPFCGSAQIATERRPDGSHHCVSCGTTWPNRKCDDAPDTRERIRELETRVAELESEDKRLRDWNDKLAAKLAKRVSQVTRVVEVAVHCEIMAITTDAPAGAHEAYTDAHTKLRAALADTHGGTHDFRKHLGEG